MIIYNMKTNENFKRFELKEKVIERFETDG